MGSTGRLPIIHALHYAREIFARSNLDADKTETGGDFVDLGGFRNFVHNHDLDRQIALRFHFSLDIEQGVMLPYFGRSSEQDYLDGTLLDRLSHVPKASVEIHIAWSKLADRPFVREYRVELDELPFAVIQGNPEKPRAASLHVSHRPGWMHVKTDDEDEDAPSQFDELLGRALPDSPDKWFDLEIEARCEALPSFDSGLSCPKLYEEVDVDKGEAVTSFMNILSRAIIGPGQLVRDALRDMRYLGPIRSTPDRYYRLPRFLEESRWSNGLGAWDALAHDKDLLENVSRCMADLEDLNTGYRLKRRHARWVDEADSLGAAIAGDRLLELEAEDLSQFKDREPEKSIVFVDDEAGLEFSCHDVGIGISQVLPVVVAALDGRRMLTVIEEPESHCHPTLQARVGDIFPQAVNNDPGRILLVETQSLHFLLRIQRRMRDTASGIAAKTKQLVADQISVWYVERRDGKTGIVEMELDDKGDLLQPWPDAFLEQDFFGKRPANPV